MAMEARDQLIEALAEYFWDGDQREFQKRDSTFSPQSWGKAHKQDKEDFRKKAEDVIDRFALEQGIIDGPK
jgi:hypothetical protein